MKKTSIYQLTTCAIMAALMCILGPVSIPIGPVPISLTTLVIYLSAMLLGAKLSTVSCGIYLLLGLVGLPVFSEFQGGIGKLAGPTGGYIIGFIFTAIICGIFADKFRDKPVLIFIGMVLGTIVTYAFGTIWFIIMMQANPAYAMSVCVIPFIPFDICKMIIALILGSAVYKALKKASLIS
jgi:biotin transport system substrate-specific component